MPRNTQEWEQYLPMLPADEREHYLEVLSDPSLTLAEPALYLKDLIQDVAIHRSRGYVNQQLGGECGYVPTKGSTEDVEQFGGGCRFNVGRARCYTDKSDVVADACVATKGTKGRQGCKRNPASMPATFASRGPTKASAARIKKLAAQEAKEIDEAFNDPIFDPINVDQLGGGCRYNTERQRCYADGSTDYSAHCIKTTGKKGKEGCARNVEGKARAAAGRAAKLHSAGKNTAVWVENPLAGLQLGGGCRYNTERSRCYADKSTDYSTNCIKTTGKKGKEGCARNIEGRATAAAGRAAKAHAAGKRSLIWVENPLMQNGGYWDGSDEIDVADYEQLGGKYHGNTGRKMSAASKAKAAQTRARNAALKAQWGGY